MHLIHNHFNIIHPKASDDTWAMRIFIIIKIVVHRKKKEASVGSIFNFFTCLSRIVVHFLVFYGWGVWFPHLKVLALLKRVRESCTIYFIYDLEHRSTILILKFMIQIHLHACTSAMEVHTCLTCLYICAQPRNCAFSRVLWLGKCDFIVWKYWPCIKRVRVRVIKSW